MFKCPHCGKLIADKLIVEHSGKIGGGATARKYGPDFYRKLQALRKSRRGGRPSKRKK